MNITTQIPFALSLSKGQAELVEASFLRLRSGRDFDFAQSERMMVVEPGA